MKVVDLFCGAGGFSLGMKRAGFQTVGAYDFNAAALAVHAANLKDVERPSPLGWTRWQKKARSFYQADLSDLMSWVPKISTLKPDVIVGGPPCQAFASAGKRLGDKDDRARLTQAFAIIVAAVHPRYFIMENVPGLRGSETFREVETLFRNSGYGLTQQVISTRDYGSAQERKRFILAGCLGETDGWMNEYIEEARHKEKISVRDVLGDSFGPALFRRGHCKGLRRSFFEVEGFCPTITSTSRRGTRSDYILRPTDIPVLNRLGKKIAFLGRGANYFPAAGDRIAVNRLPIPSFEQMAVLGGFPETWNWSPHVARVEDGKTKTKKTSAPPMTARMLMLANAVPPSLASSLGQCVRRHSQGRSPEAAKPVPTIHNSFDEWLRDNKGHDAAGVSSVRQSALRTRAVAFMPSSVSEDGRSFDVVIYTETPVRTRILDPRTDVYIEADAVLLASGLDLSQSARRRG